jgi:hypothetical protein
LSNITLSHFDPFAPIDQSIVIAEKKQIIDNNFQYEPIVLQRKENFLAPYSAARRGDELKIIAIHDLGVRFLRFALLE